MSLYPPQSISTLLAAYEAEVRPIAEIELQAALRRALADAGEMSRELKRGAWAEVAAFHFVPSDGEDRTPWGRYFKPIKSSVNKEGKLVHSPNMGDIDASVLEYWEMRASTTPHPLLKARYADLLWEFGQETSGSQNHIHFAWLAIDAYLDTVLQYLAEHEPQSWRFLDRALQLAVLIDDNSRTQRTKSALFAFYREQQRRGQLSMWWKADEISLAHGDIELSAAETQELLVGLEAALARHSNPEDRERYDPWQALEAADRLIRHRKRLEQPRQAVRTMRAAGQALERAAARANPQIAVGWLEEVLRRYRELGMIDEASRTELMIEKRRTEQTASSGSSAATVEAAAIIERGGANTLEESLNRLVQSFLVKVDIPPVPAGTNPLTPSVVRNAAAWMSQRSDLLAASLDRIRQRHGLDTPQFVALLGQSPLFALARRRFLQDAASAWLGGDPVKAIYLLVPEIEAALRELLASRGVSTQRSRSDGRGEPLPLHELLAAPAMAEVVEVAQRLHLVALLCDPGGWNIRTKLACGTINYAELDASLANWLVYGTLLVAALKVRSSTVSIAASGD
jgi:hypothetical protein